MSLKQVSPGKAYSEGRGFVLTDWLFRKLRHGSLRSHYDNNEFDEALKTFDTISDTSKILFNCGVIHATLGEHEKAVGRRPCESLWFVS